MDLNKFLKSSNLLKLLVSLLILLFLLKFVNFQLLISSLKSINSWFLVALIIIPFSIFLRAYRFMIILNKDKNMFSITDSYNLTLVGVALNIFMPASGGDIAKTYYGYKWHGIKEEMLSSSIVDKIIALLAIFIIGSIAAVYLNMYSLSLFSIICGLFFLMVVFYPTVVPWKLLNRFFHFLTKKNLDVEKLKNSFALSNKIKLITLSISLLAWLVSYLQFYIVCMSLSVEISFIYILAVASLINLSILFPLTLNGIGSGEAMMVYLFGLVNISPTLAIIISLLYSQVLTTIIPGLFGLAIIMKK
jgi:glycosyltransferase 2 family protein